jgi:hypothetical protein
MYFTAATDRFELESVRVDYECTIERLRVLRPWPGGTGGLGTVFESGVEERINRRVVGRLKTDM